MRILYINALFCYTLQARQNKAFKYLVSQQVSVCVRVFFCPAPVNQHKTFAINTDKTYEKKRTKTDRNKRVVACIFTQTTDCIIYVCVRESIFVCVSYCCSYCYGVLLLLLLLQPSPWQPVGQSVSRCKPVSCSICCHWCYCSCCLL